MSTRFRDLVGVHVEIDTSELQSKLDELEGLGWTEGTINDLIETKLSNDGYITSGDVEGVVDQELNNRDFVTESEVQQLIDDAVENGDFATPSQMHEAINDALGEAGYVTDSTLDEVVSEKLRDSEYGQRIEALEARIEELDRMANDRLQSLEAKLAATIEGHNILHDRVSAQEAGNATAMTFFQLLKQAFALLQR